MNIEYLKTFQEIIKLGSFSAVAKKLGISQPAVTFQVQRLEQELGVRLIDRSQRTILLTQAGEELYRFVGKVEVLQNDLVHSLEQLRDTVSGELSIAASTIPGEYLLPTLLAKFKQRYPAVKIKVNVSDSAKVISQVSDNTYDIGFCGIAPETKDITSFKIASDEIVLIAFPGHPFSSKEEIVPEELAGESFIFRETTSGTQQNLENLLGKAGLDIERWTPHLVLGSTQSVVAAVAAGAGIAFVSNLATKQCTAQGVVQQVNVKGLRLKRDFYCVFRQERITSRLLEVFIDFMKTEALEHG
ncbi:MAG: selenium metabolism-associated LysR family transcriptional regulator [Dehalococcoidales bacterium]